MKLFDRIKPYISARRYSLLFVAVSVLCMFALLAYLRLYLLPGWHRIAYSLVDALLLVIPFWFLRRRWRWTLLICTTLLSLFVIVAIYYARVFHELIPVRMFTLTENFGGLLFKSWFALVGWSDILFVLLLVAPFAIYFIFRKQIKSEPRFTQVFRWLSVVTTLTLYLTIQAYAYYDMYRYFKNEYGSVNALEVFGSIYTQVFDIDIDERLYQFNGFLTHTVMDAYMELSRPSIRIELDVAQRRSITDFIATKYSDFQINDTININNRSKNIVFIIVESLNAEVIGKKVNGNEIVPTLNRLIDDSTTFSAAKVIPQIKLGSSGDGQMLSLTGLFPMDNVIVPNSEATYNTFPSLAKSLGRVEKRLILPDYGQIWSEKKMLKSFGFDSVSTLQDYEDLMWRYGVDGALFRYALSEIANLRKPFTLGLITCSMHLPFTEGAAEKYRNLFDTPEIEANPRNYYAVTHYFDAELARFIDGLKEQGIWDNTILVIVSDHDQSIGIGDQKNVKEHNNPIVFIVANSGHGGTVDHVVGQVDVFPTVLQLCGHDPSITYTGVGRSMLDGHAGAYDMWTKEVIGTTDSAQIASLKKSFEISDLIIRGNYFGNK